MTAAFGAAAVLIAAALFPLLCGGFPATLVLERAFPMSKHANLTQLADRDRARHGRMLQTANGVIDFQVGGSYDPFQVGLYYTKVQLGTPPRDFYVQIDTGSDVLWVSCSSCNGCPETTGLHEISLAFFDPRSSSSAKLVSCSDQRCSLGVQASDSGCSTQNNLCSYSFQYGDGSGTSGYYVADLLNFDTIVGSSLISNSTAPVVFGCSTVQSGDLTKSDRAVDGIFGFGQQGLSVVSQLASQGVAPKAFSHCLRGDGDGGGILVLGEIIEPSIVYSPLVPLQPHYNLNLQSISVNGQMLAIDPSVFSTSSNRGTIIDSGTTLAYLTDEAYDPFLSAINAAVSPSARPIISRGNQCYLITSSLTDVFPQINLNFEGATMALGPQDYLLQQSSIDGAAVWCIGFQKLQGQGITILGDIVLKNKIFVYDLAGQRIGWANYDCSMAVNVSADMKTGKSEFVNAGELSNGIRASSVPLNFIICSVTLTVFLLHKATFMLQHQL